MIFENSSALWLLLVFPPLFFGLGLWGWKAKQEIAVVFPSVLRRLKKKQVEKYIIAGVLMALLIVALALPKVAFSASLASGKTGEIILLVDVSTSMAAQKDLNSPSRLARVKPILYEIIDSIEELWQIKISLHGFTNIARSHVPFVDKEDYPYLKDSIKIVLNVNSTPGSDTSLGQPILNVAGKFSTGEQAKLIILFSDGEAIIGAKRGVNETERNLIEEALQGAIEEGIKIITVGVGELDGAKIPIRNPSGDFIGEYAKLRGVDYISYLEEDILKEIASRTGGIYFFENNLEGLTEFIEENLVSTAVEGVTKEVQIYRPIAHWFLLAAFPVWVVFVRRHLLA